MKKENQYTRDLYSRYQYIIDRMNKAFFDGFNQREKLPSICLSINNKCNTCCVAYVSPDGLYDTKLKRKIHYLAINPKYLDRTPAEILSTIYHELCHVYEVEYIHIPRGGYHTKDWASLMLECGLNPVYFNKSRTAVSHEIIEGGLFDLFCQQFTTEHNKDFFTLVENNNYIRLKIEGGDNDSGDNDSGDNTPKADNADKPIKKYNRNKIKYTCTGCNSKLWAKSGLKIKCIDCDIQFTEETKEETEEK